MAVDDTFSALATGMADPAENAFAISPHDTDELTKATRYLYIGGAGAVKLTTINGDTVTFTALPVGTLLPIRAKLVFSTGTTATNLLGLY
jgi:hypothetical protein